MLRAPVLSAVLAIAALVIASALIIDRVADIREARIEARFPPTSEIVTVEGREIHVTVMGEGPDLVLIHGAGGNSREFMTEIGEELAQNYRLFIVDRPGFGWSERISRNNRNPFTTIAASPADQAHILSAAVTAKGASAPLVLGHSFGGAVAMAWGLNEPATGLVIVSGATMPWPGKLDAYYRILGNSVGGAVLPPLISAFVSTKRVDTTLSGVFAPQPVPVGYRERAATMLATRARSLRANGRQVNNLRPHIVEMSAHYPDMALPTEILHGDVDTTTPMVTHAIPLSETLPNANLTIMEGIGHMPHQVATGDVIAAIDRVATRAGLR